VKKHLYILDNNDSFTYNLLESVRQNHPLEVSVQTPPQFHNQKGVTDIDGLIISPGPGLPQESELLLDVIKQRAGQIPILGICLGLQALVVVDGGKLSQLSWPLHGQSSNLTILERDEMLYENCSAPLVVGHYHSWYVRLTDCPKNYIPTAIDEENRLMSIRHKFLPIWAVQYHPESFLCPQGDQIIRNFLKQI
jgi:anthranilate synthase component 2